MINYNTLDHVIPIHNCALPYQQHTNCNVDHSREIFVFSTPHCPRLHNSAIFSVTIVPHPTIPISNECSRRVGRHKPQLYHQDGLGPSNLEGAIIKDRTHSASFHSICLLEQFSFPIRNFPYPRVLSPPPSKILKL